MSLSDDSAPNAVQGIQKSKLLSLANLPSLRHLEFDVIERFSDQRPNPLCVVAELLKTCTPNSKLMSISVLVAIEDYSRTLEEAVYRGWEDWNWDPLDEPLYNLGKLLRRPILVEVNARVKASPPTMWKLGLDFEALFRSKFPLTCRSEYINWTYDWSPVTTTAQAGECQSQ